LEETRGERVKTRDEIILLIEEDNTITTYQLALKLGITEKGVEYHLGKLKSDNILKRVGSTKAGHWEIVNN
jgi:ATP-dependent DNA helicase RecG